MGVARNWEEEKRQAEIAIVNATKALAAFMESPEGHAITRADRDAEAADAEYDAAHEALRLAERDAEIRLRIRHEVRTGKMIDDPADDRAAPRRIPEVERRFTPEFLAAAAKEIGLPLAEADEVPGENSFHGCRVTGRQLYVKILGVLEDRIVADDPRVREAAEKSRAAYKAKKKAEEKRDALRREHREVLNGPDTATYALRRLKDAETIATQKAEATKARLAAKPVKDPEVVARMKAVKEKLLRLDAKHTDRSEGYGNDRKMKRGAPITWWEG